MKLRKATLEEIKYVKECRNQVKGANFCTLYGGGAKTLAAALKKADPSLSDKDSLKLARKLIAFKKGKKVDGKYFGGSDSPVYNAMLEVANSHVPTLPGLGTKISEALRPAKVGDQFMTGRQNFLIQASGAELLSCITVAIGALCKRYGIEAYYSLSIHD